MSLLAVGAFQRTCSPAAAAAATATANDQAADAAAMVLQGCVVNVDQYGWLARRAVAEHLRFGLRTVAERTDPGTRQTVSITLPNGQVFVCHAHSRRRDPDNKDGNSRVHTACAITTADYPRLPAFTLLRTVLEDGVDKATTASLDALLRAYQRPEQVDKLTAVQKHLDDLHDIMQRNIEQVMRRGETLDSLLAKSEDLSATSIHFHKKTRRLKRCCVIL